MLDLWLRCRPAAPGQPAALPGPGGLGDQPAALLDAFEIIAAQMEAGGGAT